MTEIVKIGDKKAYVDSILRSNLDDMKKDIHKDDDIVLIVDGKERIGKSVFAMLVGWYMSDGKLVLDDICLTPDEFKDKVKKAKKYDVVIFDECYLGMSSADAMRTYNRLLKKLLVTVGQKNLVIILVLPSVFDIDKYVALHRADALLHCFKHKGTRGHFSFYNNHKLKQLYILGKKMYSYWKPSPNFARRFTNFYAVDEESYRKKKSESLIKLLTDVDDETRGKTKEIAYRAIQLLKKRLDIPVPELADNLNCSNRTIYRALKVDLGDL
jgi:predicted transcriptional regulator